MRRHDREEIELISATMHELKTSLTAIIVSAELLIEESRLPEKSVQGRLIHSIIRNAHSMDERLTHFSEIARLMVGDSRFQPENIEVG